MTAKNSVGASTGAVMIRVELWCGLYRKYVGNPKASNLPRQPAAAARPVERLADICCAMRASELVRNYIM